MSTLYRSPKATLLADARGFLELFAAQDITFTGDDVREMVHAIVAAGITETSLLISRINSYRAPRDFNVLDYRSAPFRLRRIAFFAPSPMDQTFSHLMALTAYRGIRCQVFADREQAIRWLLSPAAPPSNTTPARPAAP